MKQENGSTSSTPSHYGEVRVVNGQKVVRFERTFAHPPAKVWRALIEPDGLKGWFPCRIEGERKVGAQLRFIFDGENDPPTEGTIIVFDPPHVLEYTWDGDVLRWELHPTEKGSTLIFTNSIDYPPTNVSAGWHTGFDMLEKLLDGEAISWDVDERQAMLQKEYDERFADL